MATIAQLKKEEAKQRMAALRRASKSRAAAEAEQQRASLTGGKPSRITNFEQVMKAYSKWA